METKLKIKVFLWGEGINPRVRVHLRTKSQFRRLNSGGAKITLKTSPVLRCIGALHSSTPYLHSAWSFYKWSQYGIHFFFYNSFNHSIESERDTSFLTGARESKLVTECNNIQKNLALADLRFASFFFSFAVCIFSNSCTHVNCVCILAL